MSVSKPNIQLDYTVSATFKRSQDGKVLEIDGMAIDDTVNSNMWQVPTDELAYFVVNGQFAQIRVDHGDRVEDVKGIVNLLGMPQIASDGRVYVPFKGEISGDEELLAKIEREYVDCVSPRVVGDMYCSACSNPSRDTFMNLVHICRGAWEVVRRPKLVELSIVSKGAYEHAKFKPVGFAAAMNDNQKKVIARALTFGQREACPACKTSPTLDCLSCSSQARSQMGVNQFKGEKNKMSSDPKPLEADAVKALISEAIAKHASDLAEACKSSETEAKKAAEAVKSEAEASVKKAVEAARDAVKAETTALMTKMEDFINKAVKGRAPGKGSVGSLDENSSMPKPSQFGMVAVPSYFKELAAAAEKKKSFDAQIHHQGGLS